MIEKALIGTRRYWKWIMLLLVVGIIGFIFYLQQLREGLGITGMSRDVSWGLYIANFTFLVGVAASAVIVIIPYYLHNHKEFGRITIMGEFLAVSAVIMSILFIFVDLGQPARVFNVILYPSPTSLLFWDMIVLTIYLMLNLLAGWYTLDAEHKKEPVPSWVKPLIILSIPWAISIHTVTAFIYSGLGARPFWLTALLAPRFLASAFASGPALLILLCLTIKKVTRFDPGKDAIQKVSQIVTYAMCINVFFLLVELFTAFYGGIPEHRAPFLYLLFGLEKSITLVPWMWVSIVLSCISLIFLIIPEIRRKENLLTTACIMVFISIWLEKGLGLVIPGFVPSPLNQIFEYRPTLPEVLITLGIYAVGFLVLTILFKVTTTVKEEASN